MQVIDLNALRKHPFSLLKTSLPLKTYLQLCAIYTEWGQPIWVTRGVTQLCSTWVSLGPLEPTGGLVLKVLCLIQEICSIWYSDDRGAGAKASVHQRSGVRTRPRECPRKWKDPVSLTTCRFPHKNTLLFLSPSLPQKNWPKLWKEKLKKSPNDDSLLSGLVALLLRYPTVHLLHEAGCCAPAQCKTCCFCVPTSAVQTTQWWCS